jgi:hypothetical protein
VSPINAKGSVSIARTISEPTHTKSNGLLIDIT